MTGKVLPVALGRFSGSNDGRIDEEGFRGKAELSAEVPEASE